jgi:hypothetical protein
MVNNPQDGTAGPTPPAFLSSAVDAEDAEQALREALTSAGITLPSLGIDYVCGIASPTALVELGRARPDVAMRLTEVIRKGTQA